MLMCSFGERLKQERLNFNLSRNELAKILNVSVRTVSYWENNQRECDFNTLISIANLFDVSIDYLLGRTP